MDSTQKQLGQMVEEYRHTARYLEELHGIIFDLLEEYPEEALQVLQVMHDTLGRLQELRDGIFDDPPEGP